jgi:stearoyl-CoA desaturase (Delta-9 desaturase)
MKFEFSAAGVFLITYHLLLAALLPLYLLSTQNPGLWLAMLCLILICGIGITSLYHRHYSHRTYRINKAAETVMLFVSTLALQGSALKWAHDHRLHHRHVDTALDPYSIKKGFWYAHFLWMFERQSFDPVVTADLSKNKLVMWQHTHYLLLATLANAFVVGLFGWIFNDYVGAFTLLFLLRLFINHHTTWFINSLAHTWGVKPYSKEHSAVNNWIISLLTYGEGYHNYHHTFASDYRNGTRWYQFDPTKMMIWTWSKIGVASDLRRVDRMIIAKRLVLEDKKLLLASARETHHAEIHAKAEALMQRIEEFSSAMREYRASGKKELRLRMKNLKKNVRMELRSWNMYCEHVLKPSAA